MDNEGDHSLTHIHTINTVSKAAADQEAANAARILMEEICDRDAGRLVAAPVLLKMYRFVDDPFNHTARFTCAEETIRPKWKAQTVWVTLWINGWNRCNRLTYNRVAYKMTGKQRGELILEGNALRRNYTSNGNVYEEWGWVLI